MKKKSLKVKVVELAKNELNKTKGGTAEQLKTVVKTAKAQSVATF